MKTTFRLLGLLFIIALLLVCALPESPISGDDRAAVTVVTLPGPDSGYAVGDTVPISVSLTMPDLFDSVVVRINGIDTVIATGPDRQLGTTLLIKRIFSRAGDFDISVTGILTDGTRITKTGRVTIRPGSNFIQLRDGSLNRAIREASPGSRRPKVIAPAPGLYDQGTIRVIRSVRIIVN